MSWKEGVNFKKLKAKAKKAVVTSVEENLDKIRDKIFSEAKKIGGWRTYVDSLQKGMPFSS